MENVESLVKTTLGEIEKMLNTRTVVGEPITLEGKVFIPLISVGFGFGAAGGTGKGDSKQIQEGWAEGTFGGAGIRASAVIICDERGVRIEQVGGSIASSVEKIIQTLGPMLKSKKDALDSHPPVEKDQP